MVRIEPVGRTAASALLLDESGEVIRPGRAGRASTAERPAGAARKPLKAPSRPAPASRKRAWNSSSAL